MVSNALCPAVQVSGSLNVYSRAKGMLIITDPGPSFSYILTSALFVLFELKFKLFYAHYEACLVLEVSMKWRRVTHISI